MPLAYLGIHVAPKCNSKKAQGAGGGSSACGILTIETCSTNRFTLMINAVPPLIDNLPGVFAIRVRFLADVQKRRFLEPNFM